MKNILIIHHGEGLGGGLVALVGLIEELSKENNVQVLVIFDSPAINYLKSRGVKIIRPKTNFYLKHYKILVHSAASYFSLYALIKKVHQTILYFLSKYYFSKIELSKIKFKYEVLYLNSTFISDWAFAGKKLNKKVIIHIREPLKKSKCDILRFIIRNSIKKYCDKIIAISHDNAKRIGLLNKTNIIYDPVIKRESKIDYSHTVEIENKYKYFLYLGGNQRIKGFEQFVKCLKYLDSDIKIYILGNINRNKRSIIKRLARYVINLYYLKEDFLIRELFSSSKIIYVGLTDNVEYYYRNCIATISPFSRPHAALPIIESFSQGKPVIVSDIEGMDELVNENNGLFFQNKNSQDLANKINILSRLSKYDLDHYKISCYDKYREINNQQSNINNLLTNY